LISIFCTSFFHFFVERKKKESEKSAYRLLLGLFLDNYMSLFPVAIEQNFHIFCSIKYRFLFASSRSEVNNLRSFGQN